MSGLTLPQANAIIDAACARAGAAGYRPMAVVVLDAHGVVKSLQCQDGASAFRIDIATGKAWAAVQMGASSRVLWQRANENPAFFSALSAAGNGRFIPQTGAVLVKDEQGRIVGAVGASGGTGEQDEEIVAAGVQAAGLVVG
jgi:uncharacterized protein GlcG (DUF336 family)